MRPGSLPLYRVKKHLWELTPQVSASIGIAYLAPPRFIAVELKQCENCPDLFTRTVGSGVKFCGRCMADQLQHPIPWVRGSLAAYMRPGDDDADPRHPMRGKKAASKACRIGHCCECSSLACPCPCHRRNAQ